MAVPEPAGLFFWLRPRFHPGMDPELDNIIRQTLADTQAAGRDYLSQTEEAIQSGSAGSPRHDDFGCAQ